LNLIYNYIISEMRHNSYPERLRVLGLKPVIHRLALAKYLESTTYHPTVPCGHTDKIPAPIWHAKADLAH